MVQGRHSVRMLVSRLTVLCSNAVLKSDVNILGHTANISSHRTRHLGFTSNVPVKQQHRTCGGTCQNNWRHQVGIYREQKSGLCVVHFGPNQILGHMPHTVVRLGGAVVGRRTCDRKVASSTPGRGRYQVN